MTFEDAIPHQSTIPGALEVQTSREVDDGTLIEFEFAPAGWRTKDNKVRQSDWRAYFVTVPGGKRTRVPSTTTLLDVITPKGGLPVWAEARGIEGAIEAVRLGEINPQDPESSAQAVETVRRLRLGADRARDDAATRGVDIHAVVERYMQTGAAPILGDFLPEHQGYVTAVAKWLMEYNPEPLELEQLVAHPEDGYAGRLDFRGMIGGLLNTLDYKTQERCQVYRGAHLQVGMYERAAVRCGAEPASNLAVVVFAADGEFRVMPANHAPSMIDTALAYYRDVAKPIDSACESENRRQRKQRKDAAEAVAA